MAHTREPQSSPERGWWRRAGRVARAAFAAGLGLTVVGAGVTTAHAQPRIMILGDSLQSGTGLRYVHKQASYLLQRRGRIVVHNFASPGARMTDVGFMPGMYQAGGTVRLLSGFFGMQGLIVALGTNDWIGGADLATFRDAYASLLAGLPPQLPVACLSPPWHHREGSPNANGDMMDSFRDVVREVCLAAGGAYLDGLSAVPGSLVYFPDGLHPGERGHRSMARFLEIELERLGWLP